MQQFSPGGLWVVLRPEIGAPTWIVHVMNFATWKHKRYEFDTEAAARTCFHTWTL